MIEYNAYSYFRAISTIMGQVLYFLFQVPIIQANQYTNAICLGHILIFDFIITLILTFAINLPTRGITSWSKEK